MSPGVSPAPRPPRPAPSVPPGRPWTFRRALFWVVVAHIVLILAIAFWRVPAAKPAPGAIMEFTTLPGEQMAGSAPAAVEPAPAPKAAAPAPTPPTPPAPVTPPPPPTPVEPPAEPTPPTPTDAAPEPTPTPAPAPSEIVIPPKPAPALPKPKKKPKPKKAAAKPQPPADADDETDNTAPTPTPAAAHRSKIDLTKEVSRSAVVGGPAGKGAKPNASRSAEGEGPGLTASGVADRLAKGLSGKGLDKRIEIGPPGGPSGGGGAGNQGYYDLIQKQMYGAWDQPSEFVGQHLRAKIQIHIERDGTISGATLAGSSGNAAFDASALGAARHAGRIPQPRPDDVPETVIVNFQLAE